MATPLKITIETTIAAPLDSVWTAWTTPEEITRWNAASDDWCCPSAVNDLRVGGRFCYRMEARDGSVGFDLEGRYLRVAERQRIEYALDDERLVTVEFVDGERGVLLRETFDAENEHTAAQQRDGWQAILNRFARHVEAGG